MTDRIHHRLDRYDGLAIILLALIIPGFFGPLIHHLVRGTATTVPYTDHPAHNVFAAQMRQEGRVTMPHPLYHFVLLGVQKMFLPSRNYSVPEPSARLAIEAAGKEMQGAELAALNARYAIASITTLLLFLTALGIVLWFPIRAAVDVTSLSGALVGVGLINGLMLAAPIALFHLKDHDFYFGYIGINVWHSPTVIAAKPFAVLAFLGVLAIFRQSPTSPAGSLKRGIGLAIVIVLGALAKPSFLICLVPAALIVGFYRALVSKRPVQWGVLFGAVILPAAITLAWQARVYAALTGGSHAKFSPLRTMLSMSPEHLMEKFWLSVLFPVVVYACFWSEARKRFRLNFAWLVFFIGSLFTYLVAETRRTEHGNFLWSAQLALFVLFVESALFAVEQVRARWRQPEGRRKTWTLGGACAIVLGMHVWFGVIYYAHMISIPHTVSLLYR